MKVRITELHPNSTWTGNETLVIGKEFICLEIRESAEKYYKLCNIKKGKESIWVWCKYIEVPEPSAMSELGTWIKNEIESFEIQFVLLTGSKSVG